MMPPMSDAVPEAPIHPETSDRITETEVRDTWPLLSRADRALAFHLLSREQAGDFFLALGAADQAELLATIAPAEKRTWIRVLPPDDAADVVQAAPEEDRQALLTLLDEATRREVSALLAPARRHVDRRGRALPPPAAARAPALATVCLRARFGAASARRRAVLAAP